MKKDRLTIRELGEGYRRGEISPVEITRSCLERIEKLNPALNAFITVTGESAFAEARTAEAEISRGEWRGPLHGVPIALKDLIDTAGVRTTAGSALYKERVPAEDAEIVRRLRLAGAVIVGKNNLHEFAYGGSSLISYFGEVRNPCDPNRVAGGSSGGSAAAVVTGMAYAAIGTDTAGSVREPAALCGCVGLKPTYGRVSSRGVISLSPSLDHVGPIAASVADCATVLQAIAGYDSADITTADIPVADYASALGESAKTLRVGVPRGYFYDDLDPEVGSAIGGCTSRFGKSGGGSERSAARCAHRPHFASGGVVCTSRCGRGEEPGVVPAGDAASHSQRRKCFGGGVHSGTPRAGRSSPQNQLGVCRRGFAGDPDDADPGSVDRGVAIES